MDLSEYQDGADIREFAAMLINEDSAYVLPEWEFTFATEPPIVPDDEWPGCKIPDHILNGCTGRAN